MRMPIKAIWGLEMVKKGISIAFVGVDIFQILKFGNFWSQNTFLKKISLVIFMQKNWVKMVPRQIFTGGALKAPPFLMSIPENTSCRVKIRFNNMSFFNKSDNAKPNWYRKCTAII